MTWAKVTLEWPNLLVRWIRIRPPLRCGVTIIRNDCRPSTGAGERFGSPSVTASLGAVRHDATQCVPGHDCADAARDSAPDACAGAGPAAASPAVRSAAASAAPGFTMSVRRAVGVT